MNKQELFKQADYTFQRGNRDLAKKYLTELLTAYPDDEPAWMLLAKVAEEKERKVECYQRVLKINPKNEEAKLALTRVKATINPTLPLPKQIKDQQVKTAGPFRNMMRSVLVVFSAVLLFGTTSFVVARNNPDSQVAKILAIETPIVINNGSLSEDIAPQTRANVSETYPEYAPLVDALLGFAIENAQNGMEGAPERPGDAILTSDSTGLETKSMLENSLPQPGTMTSITVTERQITSWLAMELKNAPDLPLNDIQVYLRNGRVQIWSMVNGNDNSTSALIVGELIVDDNKYPYFQIESMQIGQQVVPGVLVSQIERWLNQSLSSQINAQVPGLSLVSIKVTSGLITVSGTR
jgi:tetratricopeptide (TPR) repeat protein